MTLQPRKRGKLSGLNFPPGGPQWQFEIDNLTGTPQNSTPGTNFTFGGANADGSAVSVLSALAQDIQYLVVGIAGAATTAEDNSALLDILTDPAGGTSWAETVSDLATGFTPTTTNGGIGIQCWYYLPIFVRAGTSIGVQARKNGATAATGGRVIMYGFGQAVNPDLWWCGRGVESLGVTAATSKGTAHTPGSTGSYSSFATIGTSTQRYGAIQLGVNGSDDIATNSGYHWQIGVNSTQLAGTPDFYTSTSTSETMQRSGYFGPVWVNLPSGTAIQVRATCSGAAEVQTVAIYGVY